jgi:hypothetical protein
MSAELSLEGLRSLHYGQLRKNWSAIILGVRNEERED